MLIASIVILAFFVLAYVCILIFRFVDSKKDDYECIVRAPKIFEIFAHVFYVLLCIGISIGAVLLIAFVENDTNGALIFLALFFGSLALTILILMTFPFVAIKDNEIYKRNLFKVRTIKIEDIRSVDFFRYNHLFVLKSGARIEVDSRAKGADEFLKLVKDRKEGRIYSLNPNTVEQIKPTNDEQSLKEKEERITLSQIGKEFRKNFPKYKRKQQLIYIFGFFSFPFVMSCISLVLFIFNKKPIWFIILILCFLVFMMFVGIFFIFNGNLGKDLEHDDEWLGNKHKFDDIRVKGCAKKKFNILLPVLIVFAVCSSGIGAICCVEGNRKPVSQSQLIEVTGEFEYIRNSGKRFEDELSIGLKGDATEYKISTVDYSFFDSSFKTEVSVGDMVTIYIDSTRKPNSINYEGRTQWNYAYSVSANTKDYFTYENYLAAFNKNRQGFVATFIVCISISGLCLLGIGASFAVYKTRSTKETIEA